MGTAARDFDRYCLACRHSLRGLESRQCPECGRAFDPSNPRTTSPHSYSRFWVVYAATASIYSFLAAGYAILIIVLSAFGWLGDMGVGGLLVLTAPVAFPILFVAFLVAMIPCAQFRRRTRVIALIALPLTASVVLTGWPFRVNFFLHKAWLEEIADRAQNGEQFQGWRPIGLFPVTNVRVIEWNNVGFCLSPWLGRNDGVILVRKTADAPRVWYNTNWETDLGDGWFLVYED